LPFIEYFFEKEAMVCSAIPLSIMVTLKYNRVQINSKGSSGMPIYEYHCKACDQHSEILQKISDAAAKTCPHCGKDQLEKLIAAPAFHLKGTGWYATDYKAKPQTSTETTPEKSEATPSTKTEEKK
jgi:putative FmdB family regulatory protein